MTYSVVWFKKDLRLFDHQPFLAASAKGPILCLYVLEPSVWQQPDASHSHYLFLRECLRDLAISLRAYDVRLELAIGEATAVFNQLYNDAPFHSLYSHEETGNFHSYQRDIAVGLWCQQHQVRWHQALSVLNDFLDSRSGGHLFTTESTDSLFPFIALSDCVIAPT